MKLQTALTWCGSVIIAVSVAIAFLFTTFQTVADADKSSNHIDSRFDKIETKIDKILEQTK